MIEAHAARRPPGRCGIVGGVLGRRVVAAVVVLEAVYGRDVCS